jgi:hypothetical protein
MKSLYTYDMLWVGVKVMQLSGRAAGLQLLTYIVTPFTASSESGSIPVFNHGVSFLHLISCSSKGTMVTLSPRSTYAMLSKKLQRSRVQGEANVNIHSDDDFARNYAYIHVRSWNMAVTAVEMEGQPH